MSEMMNPEIKAKWIAALRSDEYTQGRASLRRDDLGAVKHCCLGVLCEIAVQEGVIERTGNYYGVGGNRSRVVLPGPVRGWAEISDGDPSIRDDVNRRVRRLSALNDVDGWSFEQIADAIEASL